MTTFEELVESRKAWVEAVLKPWCQTASRAELLKAAQEWIDMAGRIAPEFSIWLWCWSRFPGLYIEGLRGVDETHSIMITLRDGREISGFPDSRASQKGQLVLLGGSGPLGPFSIDEILTVQRVLG